MSFKLVAGKRYVMRNGKVTDPLIIQDHEVFEFIAGDRSWSKDGSYWGSDTECELDIVAEYGEPQQQLRWVENCVPDKPGIWAMLFKGEISVQDVNESEVKSGYLAHDTRCYLGPIPEILPPVKKVVERFWISRKESSDGSYYGAWFAKEPDTGSWIRTDETREREV